MPTYSTEPDYRTEPKQRFYPPQGMQQLPHTSATDHQFSPKSFTPSPKPSARTRQKNDDASYFMHRHPLLLQRLYDTADLLLTSYRPQDFIYDAYPDYVSLRLMRDRLLRENLSLTESFLQTGCPIEWLNLLTDTVLSELLCRKRSAYRSPSGDANTSSVQSASRL